MSSVLGAPCAERHLGYLDAADPRISFALDVFGGRTFPGPKMYPTTLEHMKASCKDVTLR